MSYRVFGQHGNIKRGAVYCPATFHSRGRETEENITVRNELEKGGAVAASPVAVTTAGELRTSVCRVVIYLQRDMSGASWLPQHHTQSSSISPAPPLESPKTETCSYGGVVSLGNEYVRLNVGGTLFNTTVQVLTRQNSMLKAMFSGKKEVFTDREGLLVLLKQF
ncbi:hypothetical protein LDENG_00240080 [Lucifuga dentata]|nr:hypothetical protein LDENG_00240080 [Lucifuga dentata]